MADMRNPTDVYGRKTFFVTPDTSLLPESYLQDYLAHGYEAYVISDTHSCSLRKKIDLIVSMFPDSILFFHIDYDSEHIEWPHFIKDLQRLHGDHIIIGVLYNKRLNEQEARELEQYYLIEAGIQGGCIALEFQRARNFALIDKVMFANQSCGRRKTVRALCDNLSELTFDLKKPGRMSRGTVRYKAKLHDISLGHFSCMFSSMPYDIPIYEKVKDIMMLVNGIRLRADAVLVMKREMQTGILFIFMFTKSDGAPGLDPDSADRLGNKIYQMVTSCTKALLQDVFSKAGIEERSESFYL